jgi:hypothetical protein
MGPYKENQGIYFIHLDFESMEISIRLNDDDGEEPDWKGKLVLDVQ